MVTRIGFLVLLVCAVLSASHSHAAVSAQLSAQNIDELETVRLTIKISETRQTQNLDLSGLEKDFHVLSTNTVSQSRFLNGRGVSWVDYQITLQPKRTGTLAIPSIMVGTDPTPSLELKVRPLSEQTRQTIDELVFFENEVSAREIYVQSELILTRRLLYSQGVQLYSDLPGAPEIKDAVVLTLGETRSDTTARNGKTYGLVEQRYAIYPESSGEFELPGISITASVRLIENGRVSRKGVRVGTNTETVKVLPVPDAYPRDKPWLPATNVDVMYVISPDRPDVDVGDTLTHELLIYINGNIGSMAPPTPLTLDEQNFRIYPAAPVIDDDTRGDTVKGSRLQTNSVVPLQPGALLLPATEIVWWDTRNKKVRVSSTSDRTLNVSGTAVEDPLQELAGTVTSEEIDALEVNDSVAADAEPIWQRLLPGVLIVLFMLAIAVALWLFRIIRRNKSSNGLPAHKLADSYLKAFNDAIDRRDAKAAFDELKHYLSAAYQCPEHLALAKFRMRDAEADAGLAALDAHFYSEPLSNEQLSQAFATIAYALTRLRTHQTQPKHREPIPPLYPEGI